MVCSRLVRVVVMSVPGDYGVRKGRAADSSQASSRRVERSGVELSAAEGASGQDATVQPRRSERHGGEVAAGELAAVSATSPVAA